jgi:hypothetical protein
MTTIHLGQERGQHFRRPRRRDGSHLVPTLLVFVAIAFSAFGYISYVLWPRWPAPRLDDPPLPITVAGAAFRLPPAAIRVPAQRRPGAQERVDLVFLWPSLEPPDPNVKSSADMAPESPQPSARVFMTIVAAGDTLAPAERTRTLYPRYAAAEPVPGPGGLTLLAFRDGTPYQGEDLIYDAGATAFLVRCSRNRAGPTPGVCLYERRIDAAEIVVRFPRDWLGDWRMVAGALDRLIASVRPLR